MSEKMIINHCAPTLAKLKTASLFPCRYESRTALLNEIKAFNSEYSRKGLVMIPLKAEDGFALIYLYRPKMLKKDFECRGASELLSKNGYSAANSGRCIAQLAHKIQDNGDFPHEVGLFLGYPPEDVRGFIDNHAANYKAVGFWKVYGDVEAAKKCFALYKKCTSIYNEQFSKGKTLHQLTVCG